MRVSIEEIERAAEEEIIIRCHEMSTEILKLVQQIKVEHNSLTGMDGERIHRLHLEDIYYFEVVDSKAFFYCRDRIYETKLKLYEFEELCRGTRFFRASKSVVLNSNKIEYIKPSLSGRFEAIMDNGETAIVSRQYVNELKKLMGL